MKVIVDASNVAHFKKNENSEPMLTNIIAAVETLEARDYEYEIIADASLAHDIDNKDDYNLLLEEKSIEEVPIGNNADHFILNLAEEEHAKILSNDKFRDFKDEFLFLLMVINLLWVKLNPLKKIKTFYNIFVMKF